MRVMFRGEIFSGFLFPSAQLLSAHATRALIRRAWHWIESHAHDLPRKLVPVPSDMQAA